jgi:hypothetical protein
MTDNLGFGRERRRELNIDVLSGRATFRSIGPDSTLNQSLIFLIFDRDTFKEMLDSVATKGHSLQECKEILRQSTVLIKIIPSFRFE